MNLPLGQRLHAELLLTDGASRYKPAAQTSHVALPLLSKRTNDPTAHPSQSVSLDVPGTEDLPGGHVLHWFEAVRPVSSEYVPAGHRFSQWLSVRQRNVRSTSSHTASSVRVAVTLSPVTEMRYVLGRVDPAGSQLDLLTKVGQVILVMETLVEGGKVSGGIGVGMALMVFALVLVE